MEEIIKRCMEKDVQAMGYIYEKYRTQVYRTAYLLSYNASLSDDITQEAFIRIFSKIHLYNESYSFESWIYMIVLNVYRNIRRKQWWRNIIPLPEDIEDADDTSFPPIEQNERKEILAGIIKTLPTRISEVVILKYYTGLSQEEIANVLGVPLGTVKSRISTGLKKIRKHIEADVSLKEVLES
jgi:RNA polymerase sigma-70 factor (ECF subfamily)